MSNLKVCIEIPVFDVDGYKENTPAKVWEVKKDAWMYEGCGNERMIIDIDTIEEGIERFFEPINEYQWGGSNMFYFESGIIFENNTPIHRISYNGKLFPLTKEDISRIETL